MTALLVLAPEASASSTSETQDSGQKAFDSYDSFLSKNKPDGYNYSKSILQLTVYIPVSYTHLTLPTICSV